MALAGFMTGRDAFQVAKLREAGAVILGKTNLHELAAGIITISSLGGQTRNPYDPCADARRIERRHRRGRRGELRGGRHGQRHLRLDPHSGGEQQPVRPARNRRAVEPHRHHPAFAYAGHRRTARAHVTDLALMLDATVGEDPADAVTARGRGRWTTTFRASLATDALKGTRIGVLKALFGTSPEDEEVTGIVRKALDRFEAPGAVIVDVQVPGLEEVVNQSSLINSSSRPTCRLLSAVPQGAGEVPAADSIAASTTPRWRTRSSSGTQPSPTRRKSARSQRGAAGQPTDARAFDESGWTRSPIHAPPPPRGGRGAAARLELSAERDDWVSPSTRCDVLSAANQ